MQVIRNGKTFHRLSIFYYHDLAKCSVFNQGRSIHKQLTRKLILFRMGIFGAAHGCVCVWGGVVRKAPPPLPKICHIYPTMMKLGTVIPYLTNIKKIYEPPNTPPEFC